MHTITLVCGGESTCRSLREQLLTYMGTEVSVESIPMDLWVPDSVDADLIIFSSSSVEKDFLGCVPVGQTQKTLTVQRTLNTRNIGKLVNIEEGEKVLFVNDHRESAQRCIDILKEIGFIHLNILPCAPPDMKTFGRTLAVTAGEPQLVPPGVNLVCDLGSRIMDFPSVLKIAHTLGIDSSHFENTDHRYMKEIVRSSSKVKTLNSRLLKMMEGISEGMLSYQFNGRILVGNEKIKRILMEDRPLPGRKIQEILADRKLISFLLSPRGDTEILTSLYSMDLILSKIIHRGSRTMVCRFKVLSEIEKDSLKIRELRKKGYYSKYRFADIIGKSPAIRQACRTAEKLAASNLTILLEGESGTGKELMAGAIHNSSSRKDQPYLAINLNAVNESLLESELFGYEPGSFTGAAREGKAGLFEQADGGTLFLDEIGDISPKIQKGLLRVLQEGEVMRIGGNRIHRTDVRIIAATNKNLADQTRKGEFREDLFYRIRQGYIQIPALRNREGDIPLLTRHLIGREGYDAVKTDEDLIRKFSSYSWPGNIRELKNIILCMLATREDDTLKLKDIPPGMFEAPREREDLSLRERTVLEGVEHLTAEGQLAAREKLYLYSRETGTPVTPSQIRRTLEDLTAKGFLQRRKDRYGVALTEKGIGALDGF